MIRCFTFFLLLFSTLSYSQFSEFNLEVTPVGVTCSGMDDGALTVSVDGITDDNVTVEYVVYQEPDLSNPYDTEAIGVEGYPTYEYVFTNLPEGDYVVHAIQKLGVDQSLPQVVDGIVGVEPEGALPCFTLDVVAGEETCPGNGALTISVPGADPNAVMTFEIYLMPGETLMGTLTTGSTDIEPYVYMGLAAGEYKIVATQYLGANSNWQVQLVTVEEGDSIADFCDFSLIVDKTDLTCDINNGKLELSVEGVFDAGVSVEYVVYKQPDMSNPYHVQTVGSGGFPTYEHVVEGLGEGEYVVYAVQKKGVDTSDQMSWIGEIVILEDLLIVPLVESKCLGEASIEANVVAGAGVSFSLHQLPNGPGPGMPTVPYLGPQTSDFFEDLMPGWYRIFVQDACGQDFPFDVNVQYIPLGAPSLVSSELEADFGAGCDAAGVSVANTIQAPYDWILGQPDYPFTVDYYVFPPSEYPLSSWPDCALLPDPEDGNGVFVSTHYIIAGGAQADVSTVVPYYPGEGLYYYMMVITDDCGNKYYECEVIDFELDLTVKLSPDYCYGLEVAVENFVGYYNVYFGYHPDHQDNPNVPTIGYPSTIVPITVYDPDDPTNTGLNINGPFDDTVIYGLDLLILVEIESEPLLDDDGNPILDPDSGQPFMVPILDSNGNPILDPVTGEPLLEPLLDSEGNPVIDPDTLTPFMIPVLDEFGQKIPLRDENGQMIPILDEDGQMIPVMAGEYWVTVVDQCGVTSELLFEPSTVLPEIVPDPVVETNTVTNTGIDLEYPIFSCLDIGNLSITHQINLKKIEIIDFVAAEGVAEDIFQLYLAQEDRPRQSDGLPDELYGEQELPLDITAYIAYPDPNSIPDYTLLFPGLAGAGIYTIQITDICDEVYTIEVEMDPLYVEDGNFAGSPQGPGCAEGFGSIHINTGSGDMGQPQAAFITDGPEEFEAQFGHNFEEDGWFDVLNYAVDFTFGDGTTVWQIVMADLPAGDYNFNIDLVCNPTDYPVYIEAYQQITEVDIDRNCGTFNLALNHWANNFGWSTANESYSLERYNEDTGEWEFIMNLLVDYFFEAGPDPDDGILVSNNGISYQGEFRIVKKFRSYENAMPIEPIRECEEVLFEFPFFDRPEIEEVYYTTCPDGETEVIVVAVGADPMTYQVWTPDTIFDEFGEAIQGSLIVENPQGDNIFVGLDPGLYIFRVIDGCGGTAFTFLAVEDEISFEVSDANLCEGEIGYLFVDSYSFIEYQWYNTADPTTILGTSSQLAFNPFDAEVHQGTYAVNIIFPANLDSCINQVVTFDVEVILPNAGELEDQELCPQSQELDLFTLFTSTDHDEDGKWEDIDNTAVLDEDTGMLQIQNLPIGTYNFRYYVESDCYGDDEAFVEIVILSAPEKPEITADVTTVCEGEQIILSVVDADSQYTYTWTLPNGNTYVGDTVEYTAVATQDAGNYIVTASLNDECPAESDPFVLSVKELPNFAIDGNTVICLGQSTTLSVVGTNFQNSDASFVWYFDGAEIPSVTTSSIDASDLGEYEVAVTVDGCESYLSVVVTEKTDVPAVELLAGCEENNYIISVVNTGQFSNATYEWTGPNGFFSTDISIDVTGLGLGVYEVVVTDADGCEIYNSVNVESTECMIPKGVAPEGDFENSSFDLSNFNVSNLQIFNRYGIVVYEADNYTKEWHGQTTNDSELLPSATYYYVITFVGGDKKTGWVYLIRNK